MRLKLFFLKSGTAIVLFFLFLNLSSCGNPTTLPAEPVTPSMLETNTILVDPIAEEILLTMFTPEKDIGINGAVGPNQIPGNFNIRFQGDGSYLALALGITRSSEEMIQRGVRAIEFGLTRQNQDGTFTGSSEQDCARFGLFGLRSYNLVTHSAYGKQIPDRLENIFQRLLRTQTYLLDQLPSHPEIYETTNQAAMLAYVLTITGQHSGRFSFLSKGESLLQWVLDSQRADGVFPEMNGHDSHYQTVTLLMLTNMYIHTSNPAHRQAIYPSILKGYQWMRTRISPSGRINDEGNTRTANNPADSPENKQINPREIALTLLYLSCLGPEFSEAGHLSEIVLDNYHSQVR